MIALSLPLHPFSPTPLFGPPLPPPILAPLSYSVYIESGAYASNLKQKLVCGSLLLALRINHWEFYSRSLRPGIDYVELDDAEEGLCDRVGRLWGLEGGGGGAVRCV